MQEATPKSGGNPVSRELVEQGIAEGDVNLRPARVILLAMSRAFVKEDVDPPERSGRVRSASGLPPRAHNYITASGAERLRQELISLQRSGKEGAERAAELERILASVTVVQRPDDPEKNIAFGAKVTVHGAADELRTYRIVGVDELSFYPDGVTWISRAGKALLAAELGDRVTLEKDERVEIVQVDYPID